MIDLREILERLLCKQDLEERQAYELMLALTDTTLPPAMAGALLCALRAKGETAQEVRGFALGMRRLARRPLLPEGTPLVDMVGTGGDGSGSFNLSTGASLLVASMGIRVAKHGTSSVSSRSGSADAVRALGLNLPLDEQAAGDCLAATGFTFLFAPHYHPTMKAIMPVRQALGVRTVFNILGPLSNPAEPPYHLLGAYHVDVAALMADSLAGMPIRRSYVVHGAAGWDEATPIGPFELFDVCPGKVVRMTRSAQEFGLPPCTAQDLKGGDAAYNARQLRAVLENRDRGAHRHAIVLQAALVLELMGKASSALEAAYMAEQAIDSGAARALLDRISAFGKRA
ncbi:anthranilate phosphoribosyltransferase [Steroidobacter denitrificans]|uniref:Anthranilate phosphoribosyltransferase n=1 Tax=Steroidobacter denitrificans TaxID=465721 RepID=A0A127FD83_STEDE|nr:anthranilate phosphoribosyltransferase [Steroidobacter denitrificans]AMN48356.1 anthranilate phosphoribosyltransferase [Steroidobacter denitrificans]